MMWTPLVVQLLLVVISFTAADIVDADYAQFRISKTSKEEYSKYLIAGVGACSGIYFDEHNETSLNGYKEWEMKKFLNTLRTVLTDDLSESEINALKSRPKLNPILNARSPPVIIAKCRKTKKTEIVKNDRLEENNFYDKIISYVIIAS